MCRKRQIDRRKKGAHHGETLYGLEIHLQICPPAREHEEEIAALARTHRLLAVKAQARRKAPKSSEKQLELF